MNGVNVIGKWIVENWFLIVVLAAIIVSIVKIVKKFSELPSQDQVEKIKACLLNWVIMAEKELGNGTGRVKLSMVYSKFVEAFPFLSMVVPFELFNTWVDEALEIMANMLQSNSNISSYIGVNQGQEVNKTDI